MAKKRNKKIEIPGDSYKSNGLYMLNQASYFNKCTCEWCLRLRHNTTVLINYLKIGVDLKSFSNQCYYGELEEDVELYTYYYHSKLSCNVIIDVCRSIEATAQKGNPWACPGYIWYPLINMAKNKR